MLNRGCKWLNPNNGARGVDVTNPSTFRRSSFVILSITSQNSLIVGCSSLSSPIVYTPPYKVFRLRSITSMSPDSPLTNVCSSDWLNIDSHDGWIT